ncbi:hypothetical protein [Gracilibacillus salinarum]|uniref:ABC-2 family transporter protein n=1 Tax=Gracilibacillus salinarum TaxID=2932255 RepID=A0ABY4GHC5_9BACI|nr:hypothetical protein [Gracilibacillus salinarum]UOQ83741.1 hypothetical protein MUN87_13355 [Gracilibacillus salinarum]
MRFFNLFKYDVKNGFRINLLHLLVIVFLVLAYCFDFYIRKKHAYMFDPVIPSGTWIDYLFYILAGIKEYIPSDTESFLFPVKWMLLHLFILYSTLHYPYRDLSALGLNMLMRTKGRLAWWSSKTLWNICYVLAIYAVIFLTILTFCFIMQEPISFEITPMFVNDLLDAQSPFDTFSIDLVVYIVFIPVMMSIAFNLLQMTIVLFIKPLYSFGMLAIMLLSSAYIVTPYLPGNYAMPIRSIDVVEQGLSFNGAVIAWSILTVGSFILGCIYFRRFDILHDDFN